MRVYKLNLLFYSSDHAVSLLSVKRIIITPAGQTQLTQQVIFAKTEKNSSRIRVINKGI